jgi:hypothetical protein
MQQARARPHEFTPRPTQESATHASNDAAQPLAGPVVYKAFTVLFTMPYTTSPSVERVLHEAA